MRKKYRKIFSTIICLLFFLFIGLFYLSINKTIAAGLEVKYPEISGQSIEGINTSLPDYIKYLFNAGMLIGFSAVLISLAIAGAMYALSAVSASLKANAKDRISGAMSGLLILTLLYLIVTTINPQLGLFNINKLPASQQIEIVEKKDPGIYFYKSSCSDNAVQPVMANIPDLGTMFGNKINNIKIQQDTENKIAYMSILYDKANFWGKCNFITSAKSCQSTGFPASSASVYSFNDNPADDGVYFYRKSYFNSKGGYLKVSNSEIKNAGSDDLYIGDLSQLKFIGMPEEEQDCVNYNDKRECVERSVPNLGGENISSIWIHGNYVVLFIYFGPEDNASGPWTSCQEFPTADDINRIGPQQIKWQNIRNNNFVIPNYVVIIPIKG